MKAHTHATAGLALGLAGINFGIFSFLALPVGPGFLTLTLISSLLPDIDHRSSSMGRKLPGFSNAIQFGFGHRGIVHSLWGMLFFGGVAWFICKTFSVGEWRLIVFAVCFGYFAHLASDSLTRAGVRWLYPFRAGYIRGPVKTGGLMEAIFFIVLIVMLGFLLGRIGWGVLHFV
jgi:inner membrane protein